MPSVITDTRRVPIDSVKPHPENARRGNVDAIADSLKTNGQYRPLTVQESRGHILVGNHTWLGMQRLRKRGEDGWDEIDVTFVDVDDRRAKRIMLADNRTAELGGYDMDGLLSLLDELDGDYVGTGYDVDSVTALMRASGVAHASGAADLERQGLKDARPNPRKLPLDAVFTITPSHVAAMIAADCGLQIGVQSNQPSVLKSRDRWEWKFRLAFVDNEYKAYDHDKHVGFVELVKPKYATVRDIMTPEQCAEAGIDYYPIEQIIEWADEINTHAERVIVIPKYDCLDDIPDRFMLGYSVPTSYGGTPLPAAAFAGRPVHLLGGSWRNQLRYLAALGDDVVSLDFNHCNNLSQWGQFTLPDGKVMQIRDVQPDNPDPSNTNTVALALSLGNIGRAIFDLTGGQSGAPPDEMPDTPPPPTDPDAEGAAA